MSTVSNTSTTSFLGSYSGITSDTIDQLIAAESGKLTQYQNNQTKLNNEKDAWRDVQTRLDNLSGKLDGLQDEATFNAKTVTSSDGDRVAATVGTTAVPGDYKIEVTQLATQTRLTSGTIAAATGKKSDADLALTGTLTLTNQDGKPSDEITIETTDSLKDIIGKINKQSKTTGISATVIGEQLVLTDSKMGERSIEASGSLAESLGLNKNATGAAQAKQTAGQSAKIMVNNDIEITQDSNTLTDAIEGLTLTLKEAGTTTVTIAEDLDKPIAAVKDFISQYNSALSFIGEQLDVGDPSADDNKTGKLVGNSSLMQLQSSLRSLMTTQVKNGNAAGDYSSDLGISVDRYGQLTLDEGKLTALLKENPTAAASFFEAEVDTGKTVTKDGITEKVMEKVGLSQKMATLLNSYVDKNDGIIATKNKTYDNLIADITGKIGLFNERMETKRAQYVATFTALDKAMMEAESQLSYLTSQLGTSEQS